jgi:alkanesulfonate monooxygenase SsuD/methylene tetrahydromethanopterin reductase-like flavin-dependent oxidoreductase (luciferase family)
VRIGIQIPDFTLPAGPAHLGRDLVRIARAIDELGFDSLWVMDHFFQVEMIGPPQLDMLEAYTTLGFLAGHTSRVRLGTLVSGVHYRHPGVLARTVATLHALSGGRAWLGIGAGWNEMESRGLGVPFPPVKARFERLAETLELCLRMWAGGPHPPIMIGGGGEMQTLRLVARYADACNLFPTPEVPRKLAALRVHCATEDRDYASIEKTSMFDFDVGPHGENVEQIISRLRWLSSVGIQTVHGWVKDAHRITPLEILAERVLPVVAELEANF